MQIGGTLYGGSQLAVKYKIGASFATRGVVSRAGTAGIQPATTTSFADSLGVTADTGTYSTTQGDTEGLVSVYNRPDSIFDALMSGGATANTALTTLTATAASTGGTTITASVGTASMVNGTVWGGSIGGNVGRSRVITTFNASTSVVVAVPFAAIAVSDTFFQCPWSSNGAAGNGTLQATTNIDQANAAIASGTGGEVAIYELVLNGATDSHVRFLVIDHVLGQNTI